MRAMALVRGGEWIDSRYVLGFEIIRLVDELDVGSSEAYKIKVDPSNFLIGASGLMVVLLAKVGKAWVENWVNDCGGMKSSDLVVLSLRHLLHNSKMFIQWAVRSTSLELRRKLLAKI